MEKSVWGHTHGKTCENTNAKAVDAWKTCEFFHTCQCCTCKDMGLASCNNQPPTHSPDAKVHSGTSEIQDLYSFCVGGKRILFWSQNKLTNQKFLLGCIPLTAPWVLAIKVRSPIHGFSYLEASEVKILFDLLQHFDTFLWTGLYNVKAETLDWVICLKSGVNC